MSKITQEKKEQKHKNDNKKSEKTLSNLEQKVNYNKCCTCKFYSYKRCSKTESFVARKNTCESYKYKV